MPPKPNKNQNQPINVLVACEYSGTVRDAFRQQGHNAWSCDLLPDENNSPYHIQGDVRRLLGPVSPGPLQWKYPFHRLIHGDFKYDRYTTRDFPLHWDIVIAHPPCTHIAVSGARHFAAKQADGRQQEGIEFFRYFTLLNWQNNRVRTWAIENPVCIMSSLYRKPDQCIQHWQFGHQEMKKTCLWLNGLPCLRPTKIIGPPPKIKDMTPEEKRTWCRIHYMSPGENRGHERSIFYDGFAKAMAGQWGGFVFNNRKTPVEQRKWV